jgi:hypothetical protein
VTRSPRLREAAAIARCVRACAHLLALAGAAFLALVTRFLMSLLPMLLYRREEEGQGCSWRDRAAGTEKGARDLVERRHRRVPCQRLQQALLVVLVVVMFEMWQVMIAYDELALGPFYGRTGRQAGGGRRPERAATAVDQWWRRGPGARRGARLARAACGCWRCAGSIASRCCGRARAGSSGHEHALGVAAAAAAAERGRARHLTALSVVWRRGVARGIVPRPPWPVSALLCEVFD